MGAGARAALERVALSGVPGLAEQARRRLRNENRSAAILDRLR